MKFQQLNNILTKLIKDLGIEREILENQAIIYWPSVVGSRIAQNTRAERINDGILFVKVKNDVWRNELLFYKDELIKKLNIKLGKQIVFDIILV